MQLEFLGLMVTFNAIIPPCNPQERLLTCYHIVNKIIHTSKYVFIQFRLVSLAAVFVLSCNTHGQKIAERETNSSLVCNILLFSPFIMKNLKNEISVENYLT